MGPHQSLQINSTRKNGKCKMHTLQVKMLCFLIQLSDQLSNGMIVATSQHCQKMAETSDAMVLTVLLSVHRDTDLKVDGRSNARLITPGPIQNSLHVSLVPAWMQKLPISTPKFKKSLSKISQLPNFSAVTHPIS